MNKIKSCCLGLFILSVIVLSGCAPVKTLDVWQQKEYDGQLRKVLVVAVAEKDNIRRQFENLLADQLSKRGVEAIPSNKVISLTEAQPDRAAIVAKVNELGIESVLVARSIDAKEVVNYEYSKDMNIAGVAVNREGWFGYGFGYKSQRQYDSVYFTVSTRLYDVSSEEFFWSHIAQVRVEGSGSGAVTELLPVIVEELEKSKLVARIKTL